MGLGDWIGDKADKVGDSIRRTGEDIYNNPGEAAARLTLGGPQAIVGDAILRESGAYGKAGDLWDDITGVTAADEAARQQEKAAGRAEEAQQTALEQQLEVMREQMDQQMEMFEMQKADFERQRQEQQDMLAPFVERANTATAGMDVLSGAAGAEAQQAAIDEILNSPMFQSQVQQGENAILANASATGGLRGGNLQASLSQFRPGMLQSQIDKQYNQLAQSAGAALGPLQQAAGGIGQISQGYGGMQSALGAYGANAANAYGNYGNNMANIYTNVGDAQASNTLANYQLNRQAVMDILNLGTTALKAF